MPSHRTEGLFVLFMNVYLAHCLHAISTRFFIHIASITHHYTVLHHGPCYIAPMFGSSNPLGEEQGHAGPLVVLGKALEKLRSLKILELSSCTLLGRNRHRFRGLIALGEAFLGQDNRLVHLR